MATILTAEVPPTAAKMMRGSCGQIRKSSDSSYMPEAVLEVADGEPMKGNQSRPHVHSTSSILCASATLWFQRWGIRGASMWDTQRTPSDRHPPNSPAWKEDPPAYLGPCWNATKRSALSIGERNTLEVAEG